MAPSQARTVPVIPDTASPAAGRGVAVITGDSAGAADRTCCTTTASGVDDASGCRVGPGRTAAATPVTVAEGRRLAALLGCAACHSVDGSLAGKVGPTWKGLFGSRVPLKGGGEVLADAAYLRESILEPQAKIVRGFDHADAGMPSYASVITDPQLTALVHYLESLR